jgi:transposase
MKNDVSAALEKPYEEVKKAIVNEPVLNIDETGTKEKGKRMWVWVFCAKMFALFHISVNRSSQVLEDILTTAFKGVICSDFYGAYKKFAKLCNLQRQYCLAHLAREFVLIGQQLSNLRQKMGSKSSGNIT